MAFETGQALLVDVDGGLAAMAAAAAKVACCRLTAVANLARAIELLAKQQFDLILIHVDAIDPVELDRFLGLDLTNHGRVILTGNTRAPPRARVERTAVPSFEALTQLIRQALLRTPSKEIPLDEEFGGMVGRTPRMQTLFTTIRRIAPLDVSVLVQGESGTGKELVAHALHTLSGRAGQFVAVNCGAIAPELLGSLLFGHERGAFTGATQAHAGHFEQAQGGTLFLDEITEMPLPLQVYLLRVLETHSLTRVGGSREIPVDARIVAASNRDLQSAVNAGKLRQDLYFRLLEFPLSVPPLRERRADIPLLARHFVNLLNTRYATHKYLDEHAVQVLGQRTWPGNVRELRHVVQRLYILAAGDAINDVPAPERPLHRRRSDPQPRAEGADLGDPDAIQFSVGMTLDDVERAVVLKTLAYCRNDKREAARLLGVSLKTIYNKLLRYHAQGLTAARALGETPEDDCAA